MTTTLLPSWVDAKNPPQWYNDGSDIDTLLEDADCLNWLSDTGDLNETYPPALAEGGGLVSSSSTDVTIPEPTPVGVVASSGIIVHHHGSDESLSFLVDPPEQQQQHDTEVATAPPPAVDAPAQPSVTVALVAGEVNQLPPFLEGTAAPPTAMAVEQPPASVDQVSSNPDDILPEHKLAGVGLSDTNLLSHQFHDDELDDDDEQAFVSALLDGSGGKED